jgi:hypothetical protein
MDRPIVNTKKNATMKKEIKIGVPLILTLLLILGACTKNFEEINTDPNQPTSVPASNHFGAILVNFNSSYMSPNSDIALNSNYIGSRLVLGVQSYLATGSEWGAYYSGLTNINKIIKDAEAAGNTNMLAAALTYRAQMTQIATDRWRDMPYSEASKADEGIIAPKFDTQETIYAAIIADLKKAADLFKAGGTDDLGQGDVLLAGDVGKWRKFCNSLRLRVAVRISNVDQSTSNAIINEVLNNPSDYPVLASNADNVEMVWPGTSPWEEPVWYWWYCCHHEGAGKLLMDIMNPLNDPRRAIWFVPATTDGQFRGSEKVGYDPANVREDISDFNESFVDGTKGSDAYFRYSEVCFLKAEIAHRAGQAATAKEAYEMGVQAAMKRFGVADADIATYMAQDGVMWKGDSGDLNKILIQKYLGNFLMENEAWADARRTDVPLQPLASNSAYPDHNRAPFRMPYPVSESALNSVNYDEFSTNVKDYFWGQKMWWDTRTGVQ